MITDDEDSIGNDGETSIETGERDWDRDDGCFLLFWAFLAIDIISIDGSDGNKRHNASAQRGSISLIELVCFFLKLKSNERLSSYLTITSYFNLFVFIPWIEQMWSFTKW